MYEEENAHGPAPHELELSMPSLNVVESNSWTMTAICWDGVPGKVAWKQYTLLPGWVMLYFAFVMFPESDCGTNSYGLIPTVIPSCCPSEDERETTCIVWLRLLIPKSSCPFPSFQIGSLFDVTVFFSSQTP